MDLLLSFKIGHNSTREVTAAQFETLIRQIKNIEQLSGVEVRFDGNITPNGKISGNSMEEILHVCDLAEKYFEGNSILHLSKLGLAICAGDYNAELLDAAKTFFRGKKPSKRSLSEEFRGLWLHAVGHAGEHEGSFGRFLSDNVYAQQKRALFEDGHGHSKTKQKHVRQAHDLGLASHPLENILLIENGKLPFNCLPRAIQIANQEQKRLTLDIGHIVRGLFDWYLPQNVYGQAKNRTKENPLIVDQRDLHHADFLGLYYNETREELYASRLEDWGSMAEHVHFHGSIRTIEPKIVYVGKDGMQKPLYVYNDHQVLNGDTLRYGSLQRRIIDRIMRGAKYSADTATLELEKKNLLKNPAEENPEKAELNSPNITNSIKYFTNTLC